jgi:hypothetical protein
MHYEGNLTMSTITLSPSLAAYIDEAGALDAEIKRLTKQLDSIKSHIKAHGAGDFGGFSFNAKVIEAAPVDRTDWETIARKFEPSYQLIAAHTKTAAPVTSIRFSKA